LFKVEKAEDSGGRGPRGRNEEKGKGETDEKIMGGLLRGRRVENCYGPPKNVGRSQKPSAAIIRRKDIQGGTIGEENGQGAPKHLHPFLKTGFLRA